MKLLKKIRNWELRQTKKPGVMMASGIALGLAIGVGIDNIAVGIAVGVALGATMQAGSKKALKNESDAAKDQSEINK
jgi:hypothetical protein